MYYDDPYDPNLPNDYDDPSPPMDYEDEMDGASSSSSTVDTRRARMRKLAEDHKTLDKGFATTTILVNRSKVKIPYYHTSYYPGSTIRNAMTGIYQTPHSVGKPNQDLYFKVVHPVAGPGDSHQLFYDSPEQFEGHFRCTVTDQVRQKWTDRVAIARERERILYNKEQERGDVIVR
jgi:hypothetical protein